MVTDVSKRKRIRLQGYDYSQNGAYFLTLCTLNRQKILCGIVGDGILDVPQRDGFPHVPNHGLSQTVLSPVGSIVKEVIQYLSENSDKTKINQYVIMPNHVHLIVLINTLNKCGDMGALPSRATNAAIPKLVSSLKRFTNKQCGREIWQRSYYDHIIRNDEDYLQIWQYIEENPLKWREDELYL